MTTPTKDLLDEHGSIIVMLAVMRQVAGRLRRGQDVPREHLEKIVEFLRNFADACHHGKEEGILFPSLASDAANLPLLNDLLGEHKTGRDYIRGIAESLEPCQPGSADAYHIAANAENYARLLIDHILKENYLLFPLAESLLTPEQLAEMEQRFEALERDVIGPGKHEAYHGWLQELRTAYLVP